MTMKTVMKNKIVRLFLLIVCLGILLFTSLLFATGQQIYSPITLIDIRWGLAPEEFGLIKGEEIETIGPRTFSIDKNGNIYIFDSVKGHIKKFRYDGEYLGNLGSNISGWAIAFGDMGQMFVLKDYIIQEYSSSGNLIKSHQISKDINLIEGYGQIIIIDDLGNLYVNRLQKIYQIGKKEQNTFKMLTQNQQFESGKTGMPAKIRGNRFQTKWENKHKAAVQILDDKKHLLKEISINTLDIFGSVLFLGQDNQGSIYIETERITKDNYVHLEVRKYDLEGNLLSTIELPNDYYTTVYKKIAIDNSGNIFQLMTTPKGVQLTKWSIM